MYETEANRKVETLGQLPESVIDEFRQFRQDIAARTLLPWGEHCTECVWPTCYTSCDLYSAREDGKCRRFVEGMVRLECPGTSNSYLLKIQFKRWGKLWAPGNTHLRPLFEADLIEHRDQKIGSLLQILPAPRTIRRFATTKRYSWKNRLATRARGSPVSPDAFVIECYNPEPDAISLTLTLRSSGRRVAMPYQKLILIPNGFHREEIPASEITQRVDFSAPFSVDIVPNDIADGTTLYFGLIDFITRKVAPPASNTSKRPKVKCIVWDLDNTLWDGILVEDGAECLKIKSGIGEIIRELDSRGILHSVASKNNFDEAMTVLKERGLAEYFLHPQISWVPKSEALKTIARRLNIGIDTLLFIDDSEFELAQVRSACPEVQTLPATRYLELPVLPGCKVPITNESRKRREMYQQENVRESAAASFAGDYFGFLRDCQIEVHLDSLSSANLERVHELTQRTNQMNFSGKRYERGLLEQIAATPHLDTYVIRCRDRFGSYGIVGFSVVDSREPRMTDLMFSCRIQAKRVEHAFLAFLLRKYRDSGGLDFRANYRKTPRNAPYAKVFADIGMEETGERDGTADLVFRTSQPIQDDGIIRIELGAPEETIECQSPMH